MSAKLFTLHPSGLSPGAGIPEWIRSHAPAICIGAILLLFFCACSAQGSTIISQSANTTIVQGVSFAALEFENPLAGTETVQGYQMLEWRDADYAPGPPRWYDDWMVSHPNEIDGNPNEIWMRKQGHSAWTSTTIPSRIVSIHLTGDSNDGIAQVMVDGIEAARLDMNTQGRIDRVIVIVKGLVNTPHQITVNALGPGLSGMGDDVAINGAAALQKPVQFKWVQPPEPGHPDNFYLGWNEFSVLGEHQIAADDWICETMDPVTDIHWWGSFIDWNKADRPPVMPAYFHITIWTDVPAGADKPYSHPGRVIWQTECHDFNMVFAGWDYDPRDGSIEACFRFDQLLKEEEYFYQEEPGQVFWISIAAVYPPGTVIEHPWGWKTRPRRESPAPDDAVRIFAPTIPKVGDIWMDGEPIFWPGPEESWDLAFELTTKRHGLKWDQPADPSLPGLHAHDYTDLTGGYRYTTLADDWICPGGLISDLEWWGNYELDFLGNEKRGQGINHFYLSLHLGNPGVPGTIPGPQIWGGIVPLAQANETDTGLVNSEGGKIYKYRYDLPQMIPQEPGNQYWFDLRAVSNAPMAPAIWRWQEAGRSPNPKVSPAVQSDTGGPWSPIIWSGPKYSDMAFQITSTDPDPNPGIKWSQPPEPYIPPNSFNGWDEISVYGGPQIVADDWLCMMRLPVTDIHWWGSFKGWSKPYPPQLPDAFHFAMWTDVPQGVLPFSHPGTVIWQTVCEEYTWEFVGWDIDPKDPMATPDACFLFQQDLKPEEYFKQENLEQIFWLSISAMYRDDPPVEHQWGWKTRPRRETYPPDDAVRIFDPLNPGIGHVFKTGEPIFWPVPQESWDTSFVLTTLKPGKLTLEVNKVIRDHFWWPRPQPRPNEMSSITIEADPEEAVLWNSITLQAFGSGNDVTDIGSVNVYLDQNDNGKVDAGDVLVGSGTYPMDNGTVTITVGPPPVIIPAGHKISVVIAYMMNPVIITPPPVNYAFQIVGAMGTGEMTGISVPVSGLPINSARKIRGPVPHRIGDAKLLNPLGSKVLLEDKVVTANFISRFGILYVSEPDRAAGIGVVPPPDASGLDLLNIGDRVSIYGPTAYYMNENTEVVINAEMLLQTDLLSLILDPLRMNNRSTGGGVFGNQPAVMDMVDPSGRTPSRMTNNIGSLIDTFGRVTGSRPAQGVIWLDDGTNLKDGNLLSGGIPALGVAVLLPSNYQPMPSVGWCLKVTGIIWAVPAGTTGNTYPVRLLVPRDSLDIEVVSP